MIRKIMIAVFGLMLAVSLTRLAAIERQENVSSRDYAEAVRLVQAPSPTVPAHLPASAAVPGRTAGPEPGPAVADDAADPEIHALQLMDIEALREVNRDVMGWIRIPDTDINYPLLRGEDNAHYLKYNWKNKPSAAGAIFMEHENAADFSDFNTIIYGHNMRSGSMFGGLKAYRSRSYWEAHPSIYIRHDHGVWRYDIFAAHRVRVGTITYAMQIKESDQREEFIRFALDHSEIDTGIEPAAGDHILTLSTCTGDYSTRWVVQGVLNEAQSYDGETP